MSLLLSGRCHPVGFGRFWKPPLSSSISMPAGDSPVESDLPGSSLQLAAIVMDVISSPVVSTSCRASRRSMSPGSVQVDRSFLVPLIVRQARHLPCILNLHLIRLCVWKDLLRWPTTTLGLGTTRVVVPTSSRPTGILILLSRIDTWFTSSPPTVPGVGGGTGICPLIGPGPQRMDPVHAPVANHRRYSPTTA